MNMPLLDNYNNDNVFAKIIRGEMPCHKIYEDEGVLSFLDIFPQSEGHAIVIPKNRQETFWG
jgi:histidine triad (HIT) family protein